ncbi:MAG: ABC transporter permease [Ruminococcaceae bacterium]|nr:ABC transporter permease [Oscillospiraceae bacterium]
MVILLIRKMLRDIKKSAVTYGICTVIVAVGFCGYSVLSITADHLVRAKDYFYKATSFSEGFAEVQEAPLQTARKLEQIPGIQKAEGRLVHTVRIDGLKEEDAELQLVSIGSELNLPLLSRGTPPEKGKQELAAGDDFFDANGFYAGEKINLIINGKKVPMTVTAAGISPENIYMVKSISDMIPDPAAYGAGFLSYETLSGLLQKDGLANNFVFTLMPGYSLKDVKDQVEQVLEPYGCYRVYDRSDQSSVSMLESELDQLDQMAQVIPFLFLSVAAIILYITLHRLIEQQRIQAGTLMALGFSARLVELHYLAYGAAIGLFGGSAGGVLGSLSAKPLVSYYQTYFSLPNVTAPISVRYLVLGTVMSTFFCAAVGWGSAHSLSRLSPCQALRPPAPKAARKSLLERIPRFTRLFTVPGLMAVRSLSRNKRRTALSLFGIACAYMITASLTSMNTLFDVFLFDSLEKSQQQDISVNFSEPVKAQDAFRAIRDPAIETAEGVVELPATIKGISGSIDTSIKGISESSALYRLFDENGHQVAVQPDGIVLSRHNANRLGVGIGDSVEIEVSYPRKLTSRVPVTSIIAEYLGSGVYMSYSEVGRVSDYRGVYTSLLLKAPSETQQRILQRVEDATAVSGIESRSERIAKMRSMMGSMEQMMASMAMMGVLIGFSVIYTSSLISFEELKREVSTMMVLGLNSRQCLDVISTGQWLLTFGGILLGIPMTMGVSRLMSASMASDLYTIPDFVDANSLLLAVGLTLIAVMFSSGMVFRKLKKLSLAELLRERE